MRTLRPLPLPAGFELRDFGGQFFWDIHQAGRFLNYLPDPNAVLESYYSVKLKQFPFINIKIN